MAKRLIDADKFLQWVVKRFKCVPLVGSCDNDAESMRLLLAQAPTVDAVEVCYCKDCKYARPLNDREKLMYLDECKVCYNGDATIDGYNIVMPEHFCSYGERRCE